MKVYAVSDLHIDYEENYVWLKEILKERLFKDDVLIIAGDLTDDLKLLEVSLKQIRESFYEVLFIPGNHDLWVRKSGINSIEKLNNIFNVLDRINVRYTPLVLGELIIIPLLGWYDYSFGQPSQDVLMSWMDFYHCQWPNQMNDREITLFFTEMNKKYLRLKNSMVITFSHFVPRIDLMPAFIPKKFQDLYPLLGSTTIEKQIRSLQSHIHVFGHTHVNINEFREGTLYLNNAFGYPYEKLICRKDLVCIFEKKSKPLTL